MNKLLLTVCMLSSICCGAQKDTIPKKSNLLIIGSITFSELKSGLLDKGYFFQNIDTSTLSLSTQPHPFGNIHNLIINARIKNDTAYISGLYNTTIQQTLSGTKIDFTQYDKVCNCGMVGSYYRDSFKELTKVVKSFNRNIKYAVLN